MFYEFWVELNVVTYRMHLEAEFCWLHIQNSFGSRILRSHIHTEVNHTVHMKIHEMG